MKRLAAVAFPLIFSAAGFGQSVWTPAPGQFSVTAAYAHQQFPEFWVGKTKVKAAATVPQDSVGVSMEYGISRELSADVSLGYSRVSTTAFGGSNTDSGASDTQIGVRYRVLDERFSDRRYLPSLAIRVGGIIKGSYTAAAPFSAGDGGSGIETSVLMGKAFGQSGVGTYGDIGFRHRNNRVPQDVFGSVGVYKAIRKASLNFGYRHINGLSGMNIGDPGFTFPRLKEITQTVEFGGGFSDRGGRYYQVFAAKSVAGRNSGNKTVIGVAMTFSFNTKAKRDAQPDGRPGN